MSEQPLSETVPSLESRIEALLFVAGSPVTIVQIAEVLEVKMQDVEGAIQILDASYRKERGLSVQRHGGRIQLTTAANMAGIVERFLGLDVTTRLSRPALETLSIIAYRQPVTRPGIDAIRGVNSDGVLKSLLMKGLVQEVGRTEGPGRPILYGTTGDFLQYFGLNSLNELPPYELASNESEDQADQAILKD